MSWYWVEKGAAVSGLVALAGVLACLLAQGLQTAEMERLRKEVARLRLACGARRGEEESAQFLTAAGLHRARQHHEPHQRRGRPWDLRCSVQPLGRGTSSPHGARHPVKAQRQTEMETLAPAFGTLVYLVPR
ncbi:uncharacterized protein LOC132396991 isoform X3 [Hypanus sabinus]|uniref:uncharacterized protein LOC132396991 isoform X3 n=1 Tax=Hypanus sabinus TaxID=79690 RepID=UPI0028C4D732|nr:uncharacterized protein LOC132396991 isoform X3 [Hypanus sabinus]